MSTAQLWQQCQNLTHHSLQAFLLSIIQRPHIYNFYQFLKHPQIQTVDPKVLEMYKIFVFGTYSSVNEEQLKQLSPQKILKLKKLTILSLFQGLTEISLPMICQSIASSREQAIDLLIEMSIACTIDIRINQKLSTVQIHYAQIRGRSFGPEDTRVLEGMISNVLAKNNRILSIIDDAFSEIRNDKNEKRWEGKETSLGKRMFSG